MEVACPQCAARYAFDDSAIPAEGYDAQCTNCSTVFFVKPPAAAAVPAPIPPVPEPPFGNAPIEVPSASPAPAEPQLAPTLAEPTAPFEPAPAEADPVPVADADAIPMADADVIPMADAEAIPLAPTQPVADSDPHRRGTAKMEPMDPPPSPEPMAMELTPTVPIGSVEEPMLLQEPGPSPVDEPVPGAELAAEEAPPDNSDELDNDVNDMMALSAELGEPVEAPDGFSPEGDFEEIMRGRRRRTMIFAAVIGVIVLYSVGTYAVLPQVFDSTVGPLIGVKAAVHPDAIPLKDDAFQKMLADTEPAYEQAQASLTQALEIDDQYPEAIALAAMVHVFRGSDIQEQGRTIQAQGNALIAEMNALKEAEKKPKGTEKKMADLRKQVDEINAQATQYFEKGGDELRKAQELLGPALEDHSDSPMVVFASGIYMTTDPDRHRHARERLKQGMDRVEPGAKLDLENLPNVWPAYLQARANSGTDGQKDVVEKSYRAALAKEPGFHRAKYQLARFLWSREKRETAKELLEELVESAPEHKRAKALLEKVSKPGAEDVEQTPGPEATPTETPGKKKAKQKRRRRRRRR